VISIDLCSHLIEQVEIFFSRLFKEIGLPD